MEYTVYLDRFHPHVDLTGFLIIPDFLVIAGIWSHLLITCEIIVM